MGILRLYRKFYCVSTNDTPESYTLITPTSITASSFIAGTGGTESLTMIETGIPLTEEETGIFYADLDKKLITRFRIMPFNVANQLDFEISDTTPIEYELIGIYN
jgi:hypothetical protein